VDPGRVERRRVKRQGLRRKRVASGLGGLAAAALVGLALSGFDATRPGHAALSREGHGVAAASAGSVQTFDIVASGDLLIHAPVWQRASALGHGRHDFRPCSRG
jgi:hypothetical protein